MEVASMNEFPELEQYIRTPQKIAEKQDMMAAIIEALRGQQVPAQGAIGASIANMPQQSGGGVVSATPNGSGYASGAAMGQKIASPIVDYLKQPTMAQQGAADFTAGWTPANYG